MRAALPGLLIALLLAVVAGLYWLDSSAALPDLVAEEPPRLRVDASGTPTLEPARAPIEAPAGVTPVQLRFLDASSGLAIAGARVFDIHGEILGHADAGGVLQLLSPRLNTLVFGADGYLVEHFFDRPDTVAGLVKAHARRGFVEIALEPDHLTLPVQLQFVDSDGSALDQVSFQLRSLARPAPTALSVPTVQTGPSTVRPELRRSWQRHALLSTMRRPDFNPELLHFGAASHTETFHCDGRADLRLVAAGRYRIEAWSGTRVGHQIVDLYPGDAEAIVIRLGAGEFLRGTVVSAVDGRVVAGAQVVARRQGRIVTSGEADAAGSFAVGPLAPGPVSLEVHHPDFATLTRAGVHPGAAVVSYALQTLPLHRVFGLLRRRSGGPVIVGAEVRLTSGLGVVATARSDASGRFELVSTLIEPTLEVLAEGFLDYAEMINANGEPVAVELLPAQPEARRQAGLCALISGTVSDGDDRPVANCPVRIQPQTPWASVGIVGRRILRGGMVPRPSLTVSDARGHYSFEWPRGESVDLRVGSVTRSMSTVLGEHHRVDLRDR